jgi:hypothetical protein
MKKVGITGATGRLATILIRQLKDEYQLKLFSFEKPECTLRPGRSFGAAPPNANTNLATCAPLPQAPTLKRCRPKRRPTTPLSSTSATATKSRVPHPYNFYLPLLVSLPLVRSVRGLGRRDPPRGLLSGRALP